MRFPISPPLLYTGLLSFLIYNDLFVENLLFSPFLPNRVLFEALDRQGCFPVTCGMTVSVEKPESVGYAAATSA